MKEIFEELHSSAIVCTGLGWAISKHESQTEINCAMSWDNTAYTCLVLSLILPDDVSVCSLLPTYKKKELSLTLIHRLLWNLNPFWQDFYYTERVQKEVKGCRIMFGALDSVSYSYVVWQSGINLSMTSSLSAFVASQTPVIITSWDIWLTDVCIVFSQPGILCTDPESSLCECLCECAVWDWMKPAWVGYPVLVICF